MRIAALTLVLALFGLTAVALAQIGDPAAGEAVAKRCTCHTAKHDLDGKSADWIAQKMRDYRNGQGTPYSMVVMSKNLTDQQINDVASYFASQPKP
ncbi:hypothetical protein dsx2_0889 [Desulfovibrio sp. X2]|uniref:c-type cytochrome n=1 Tax=Desulfovibrio sp. X2 TaxID=941449 RepID=UPI000358B2B8|nr:hypothetical protein [Desulfovibrio sp. X2]EPR37543.1 hypothetical protein dsx2_0889 [Desulfovibrio sp. X2]